MTEDLIKAREVFEQWRETRKGKKARIPKELWVLACKLAKKYGHTTVASVLNLHSGRLKKEMKSGSSSKSAKPKKEMEVVKLAPIKLVESERPRKVASSKQSSIIAEIISPPGNIIRFYSGIDKETLKALAYLE